MAKIALLIGVSDYSETLTSLPGTERDLSQMRQVLANPKIGGFDQVEMLLNPNRTQMAVAIETLFTDANNRNDLILLYFSGHGIRDDNGVLYLATSNIQKSPQGRIRTSTAVSSNALQDYMSQSRSRHQVLILDCCFSGAFARGMTAKDDETVDVKTQLGGEGRVVLTSSTATQVSYEKEGASLYTTYLVQGLETGAADKDGDGQITVDELHGYAREKVQEQAPTIRPEIYAVREGYKIFIAHAPQGDPRLVFRKAVDTRAKIKQGKLSPIDCRALNVQGQELRLSPAEARQIIDETLQPYQAFWAKLKEFESAVKESLDHDPPIGASSIDDLKYLQRVLKLRDGDIVPLLNQYQIDLTTNKSKVPAEATKSPSFQVGAASLTTDEPDLESELGPELGIDYTRLRDLLKAGKWEEADLETLVLMLKAAGNKAVERGYLTLYEVCNFPCKDLCTIDKLWVYFSRGKFGFSVQKQIWLEVGGILDFDKGNYVAIEAYRAMVSRNGWRVNGKYINLSEVTFDTSAPDGHLPYCALGWVTLEPSKGRGVIWFLAGCFNTSLASQRDIGFASLASSASSRLKIRVGQLVAAVELSERQFYLHAQEIYCPPERMRTRGTTKRHKKAQRQ